MKIPTAITGVPTPAVPHQTEAVRHARRELACLDLEIVHRKPTPEQTNLLRRAYLRANWRRFDEAATVPGSL